MSIVDKVIAAVTPPESDEARAEARQKARAAARPGDWLSQILDHHLLIEDAFAAAKNGTNAAERTDALKRLGFVLTGHAQSEEATVYAVMGGDGGQKGHAAMGYDEQALVKIQMGAMEKLDPMSQDWLDKLGHIEGAVKHHVYQEEGTWYPELAEELPAADQAMLTERYIQEWERYTGGELGSGERKAFFN